MNDLIAFDEIADFSESQYTFIIGWNRTTKTDRPCRVVAPEYCGKLGKSMTLGNMRANGVRATGYQLSAIPPFISKLMFLPAKKED